MKMFLLFLALTCFSASLLLGIFAIATKEGGIPVLLLITCGNTYMILFWLEKEKK